MTTPPITMAVLEVARHAQQQWREWLMGNGTAGGGMAAAFASLASHLAFRMAASSA